MAATRLIALHINKGRTIAQCLRDRTDYAQNPEKTEKGKKRKEEAAGNESGRHKKKRSWYQAPSVTVCTPQIPENPPDGADASGWTD